MWKSKRYARKSIYHGCMVWIEKSLSFWMPISDPRDRFFDPHHIPMKDAYNIIQIRFLASTMVHVIGNHSVINS